MFFHRKLFLKAFIKPFRPLTWKTDSFSLCLNCSTVQLILSRVNSIRDFIEIKRCVPAFLVTHLNAHADICAGVEIEMKSIKTGDVSGCYADIT